MLKTRTSLSRLCRTAALAVTALALVALPGCMGNSDEDDAKEVVKDYAEAIANGDGKKVCDTLSEDAKRTFERRDRKCEDTFKSVGGFLTDEQKDKLKDIDPNVEVDGDNATATVEELEDAAGSTEVKLKKEDGDWKITFAR